MIILIGEDELPTLEEKLTDDITDGAMKEPLDSIVDTHINLENESRLGK